MIKKSIHPEEIIPNLYAPNRGSKYIKQNLGNVKMKNDKSKVKAEDPTIFSVHNSTSWQKNSKGMEDLNNAIKQLNLIDMSKVFHTTTECKFFSGTQNIHYNRPHQWPNLKKFKRT